MAGKEWEGCLRGRGVRGRDVGEGGWCERGLSCREASLRARFASTGIVGQNVKNLAPILSFKPRESHEEPVDSVVISS